MEAGSHQKPYRSLDRLRRTRGIANPPAFSSHIKRRVPLKFFQKHSLQHHLVTALPSSFLPLPSFSFPSVASSAMIDSLEEGEGCVRAHISSPLSDTKASLSRELSPGRTSGSKGALEREYFFTVISCLIQVASDLSCTEMSVDLPL